MSTVTIKLLEVRLEVEGDTYEQEFVRLFNEQMGRWQRLQDEQQRLHHIMERERRFGDGEP